MGLVATDNEPDTFSEAMKGKDADLWSKAVQTELDLLKEDNTWTIVDNLPDGEKAISTK